MPATESLCGALQPSSSARVSSSVSVRRVPRHHRGARPHRPDGRHRRSRPGRHGQHADRQRDRRALGRAASSRRQRADRRAGPLPLPERAEGHVHAARDDRRQRLQSERVHGHGRGARRSDRISTAASDSGGPAACSSRSTSTTARGSAMWSSSCGRARRSTGPWSTKRASRSSTSSSRRRSGAPTADCSPGRRPGPTIAARITSARSFPATTSSSCRRCRPRCRPPRARHSSRRRID